MQRIARDSTPYPSERLQQLEASVVLLQRHFPPSVASLFAIPRSAGDGQLSWWSTLGGQPQGYAQLDARAREQLLERYRQHQQSIGRLADELGSRGQSQQAGLLRELIGSPDLDNLYSLNGEPVVVRWGAPTLPAATTPAAIAATTTVPVARRRLSPAWLLLLLLPLLFWLLWSWRGWLWGMVYSQPVGTFACTPGARAPDFALVLDTSGSMNLNINATAEEEEWFFNTAQQLPDSNPRKQQLSAQPTRLSVAQAALGQVLDDLHPAIASRLLTFQGCQTVVDHGLFGNDRRTDLRAHVQLLGANDGTPLALSLEEAARRVDGRFKDALVVMFVDGEDGCERNACAVSEQIARQQPRLRVNVVNISDSQLSNCIAENTGGRVYSATDAAQLQQQLRQAIEEVSENPDCGE